MQIRRARQFACIFEDSSTSAVDGAAAVTEAFAWFQGHWSSGQAEELQRRHRARGRLGVPGWALQLPRQVRHRCWRSSECIQRCCGDVATTGSGSQEAAYEVAVLCTDGLCVACCVKPGVLDRQRSAAFWSCRPHASSADDAPRPLPPAGPRRQLWAVQQQRGQAQWIPAARLPITFAWPWSTQSPRDCDFLLHIPGLGAWSGRLLQCSRS